MKKTFIYGLFSDSDKVIRYVGKSDNPEYRLKRHIYQRNDSKTHKNNWINKLLENNEKLLYKILEVVDYDKWSEKEKKWISKFDNLVNTSEGGLGGASIKYNITYLECKKWIVDNLVDIDSKTKWYNNVGNLNSTRISSSCCNSSNYGYCIAGSNSGGGAIYDIIERITFPFDSGTATNVGSNARSLYGCSSCDATDFNTLFV